jgi:hypothetical protein
MARNSQTALNEILGICTPEHLTPDPAVLTSSGVTSGTQTPDSNSQQDLDLSTSKKSVAEYFTEKLAARKKSTLQSTLAIATVEPPFSTTPPDSGEIEDVGLEEKRRRKEERREKRRRKDTDRHGNDTNGVTDGKYKKKDNKHRKHNGENLDRLNELCSND